MSTVKKMVSQHSYVSSPEKKQPEKTYPLEVLTADKWIQNGSEDGEMGNCHLKVAENSDGPLDLSGAFEFVKGQIARCRVHSI